ncbi:polyprenyl synthetase family protein [Bartonella sp. DGB1]|uniref:polyprenyl synthetase family protein n=1 Tax=Bartonella sp. DGB1 TaxID=3239807 RepID=UPI003523AC1D
MPFINILDHHTKNFNDFLTKILTCEPDNYEKFRPITLLEAIRYISLNGGKRIRPFIIIESSALFDNCSLSSLYVAASLELLHCYSLAHDDLPAMDDDDIRRGKPTLHKAYDEATAILVGDALLTMSFSLLSSSKNNLKPHIALELISFLSQAAGVGGMVAGQYLDLNIHKQANELADIENMQSLKTAMLFEYAAATGAIMAEQPNEITSKLRYFGQIIGQAFQISDDLLDLNSNCQIAGKKTQKDLSKNKVTLIDYYGETKTKAILKKKAEIATEILAPFGKRAKNLQTMINFIINRTY